jgi:Family of unknown function (DUF6504)
MAHRYQQPIKVTCAADGMPTSFCWRDQEWQIAEVFDTWHLMDRWWAVPANPATHTYSLNRDAQDRTYFRVCCRDPGGIQVFDLFHDAVTLLWVLDVAHD